LDSLSSSTPPFFILLAALRTFTQRPPYTLPLSAALPDIKSDTTSYVSLQKLYKTQAEEEKRVYKDILKETVQKVGVTKEVLDVDSDIVDEFVRNAHGLVVVRGKRWGEFVRDKAALGVFSSTIDFHL
jgi:amyloid beta precursor protein binding protein 1